MKARKKKNAGKLENKAQYQAQIYILLTVLNSDYISVFLLED